MSSNIFDRLTFLSLFLVLILLPLFALPFTSVPVETSKGFFLVIGLAITIIFWAVARFFDGTIILPKSWLIVSGGGISLALLLSALVSNNPQVSLFGLMFDIGTFWFIFAGFVLMLMSAVVFRTAVQAKNVLLGIILSSGLVLLFQSIYLISSSPYIFSKFPLVQKFLSLGILPGQTGNLIGSWNALGLFAGFATLMFLLVIEFFPIPKWLKIVLNVFTVLSILLAATVNFSLVWLLLGISSLIIFVYKASISLLRNNEGNSQQNFPAISLVVVIVSLLFFISGQFVGNIIPNTLGITNAEISPSFGATASTAWGVLKKDPVFGIGPNRFAEAWSMYKPLSINQTMFWDVPFDSGSGLLPTLMTTTGSIGLLAWIIFLIIFLVTGIRSVFSSIKNGVNWEMMAFFVLSLYLFISMFFYATGGVLFLLGLAFTGVFIGLTATNSGDELTMSFLNDHRRSFFSILALILVIILSVTATFKYLERFTSVTYFSKSLTAATVPEAEISISRALSLYTNDLYLRTYSQIYLIKLNELANKEGELTEEEKTTLQNSFDQAVRSAQLAVGYNPSNVVNHKLLGSIYQAVGALGVKDAYANAVEAFKGASDRNPLNPGLKLAVANASFLDNKLPQAREFANAALELKPDYIDAYIVLSQIAKKEGNNAEAVKFAEQALSLAPGNKDLVQYVNTIKSGGTAPAPVIETPSSTSTKTEKAKE